MISPQAVLNCSMDPDNNDVGASSVREYLTHLLLTLWEEREGFSGKRPFGNSDWDTTLYIALIRDGLVEGELDEEYDHYLNSVDQETADALIRSAIKSLTAPIQPGDIIVAAERDYIAAQAEASRSSADQTRRVADAFAAFKAARRLQESM